MSCGVAKPGAWTCSRRCCELQRHSREVWGSGPAVFQSFYMVAVDVLNTCVVQGAAVGFMPCLELCWHHPGRLPWALGVPLEKLMVMTVAGIHTGPLPRSASLLYLSFPKRCFMSINTQSCSTFLGWTGSCGWSSRLTRGSGCVTHPGGQPGPQTLFSPDCCSRCWARAQKLIFTCCISRETGSHSFGTGLPLLLWLEPAEAEPCLLL